MSDKSVEANGLADAVAEILEGYSTKVTQAAAEAVKATAEDCVHKIQNNIGGANIKGTGKYRASWKAEIESQNSYETVYRVHAGAPYYRLTHLLEKGHLIVVHGVATGGSTKKYPHIRPAVRDIEKEFGSKLQVGMKK